MPQTARPPTVADFDALLARLEAACGETETRLRELARASGAAPEAFEQAVLRAAELRAAWRGLRAEVQAHRAHLARAT